jgi:indoleamine 2,3-dioxygenase
LEICAHLDLPPVATYAGTVLWNWKPINITEPVDSLENIFTLHTLTGSMDESWFFLVSIAIEARSGPLIPLLLDAILAARYNDQEAVTEALRTFAERLDELGGLLSRMHESCDPHVFYHRIRPYLAGWKNMEDAGLPKGVLFDTGSQTDAYVQLSGGSNAQSSLFQFFDIILGVEHRPTGASRAAPPSPTTSSASLTSLASSNASSAMGPPSGGGGGSNSFIHDMRRYMPGPHRRFLQHVERVANLRDFVSAHADENGALRTAYDACLAMLRAFRDAHIRIVSRYIIAKSRAGHPSSTSASSAGSPAPAGAAGRLNLASASSKAAAAAAVGLESAGLRRLRGTGGTALIPFLKQARDETGEPAIDAWARRLLSNGPATVARGSHGDGGGGAVEGARLSKIGEHASGEREIVGLAGVWRIDDSEGGICHW